MYLRAPYTINVTRKQVTLFLQKEMRGVRTGIS